MASALNTFFYPLSMEETVGGVKKEKVDFVFCSRLQMVIKNIARGT